MKKRQLWDRGFRRNSYFASCVGYFDRTYYGFCVTSSRLLYSPYWGGQNLTTVIYIYYPIYCLRPSFSLPLPSRNSDPGSHSRLFSPLTHYGPCLAFFFARCQLFLPCSTQTELRLLTLLIDALRELITFLPRCTRTPVSIVTWYILSMGNDEAFAISNLKLIG